ncbi:MAG: hypothetical protein DMF76_27435, partial [Acidobacteria bacterium]
YATSRNARRITNGVVAITDTEVILLSTLNMKKHTPITAPMSSSQRIQPLRRARKNSAMAVSQNPTKDGVNSNESEMSRMMESEAPSQGE